MIVPPASHRSPPRAWPFCPPAISRTYTLGVRSVSVVRSVVRRVVRRVVHRVVVRVVRVVSTPGAW